jgi:hypothetical protein
MRPFRALAFLAGALAVPAGAGDNGLQIGPLRFGISFEDAQRDYPLAQWSAFQKSEFTGVTKAMRAAEPFEIVGVPFLAEIYAPKLGEYKLRYVRVWSAENSLECEGIAAKLIAHFETQFGPFEKPNNPAAQYVMKAGERSSMMVIREQYGHKPFIGSPRKKDPAHMTLQSRAHLAGEPKIEFGVRASYERLDNGKCGVEFTATRAAPARAPERYPLSAQSIRGTASISSRNDDLRRLSDLPREGIEFLFDCKVRRGDGNVDFCKPVHEADKKRDRPFLAALFQAMAMTLDVEGYDPDDPWDLDVRIPIKLSPADLRTPNLEAECQLEAGSLTWTRTPKQVIRDYPASVRNNLPPPVEVACEIQADGSLICALALPAQPLAQEAAELAVRTVEQGAAALQSTAGNATSGCIVHWTVSFN